MRPTVYQGIAAACVAGLLAGAAMRPELAFGDDPSGPQMLAGVSGERDDWSDVGMTGWNGPPPDYVLGTDYTRPPAYDSGFALVDADEAFDRNIYVEPIPEQPPSPLATWNFLDEPRPAPTNPSEGGDILAGVSPPAADAAATGEAVEAPVEPA